ncbi:hypothetical protein E4U41_007436 [Claviceps citrina]|nr:hypothetical protein E4U41_007436 [Claviceps citrina]
MAHEPTLSNGLLDSRGLPRRLALVVEWNDVELRVLCPYCKWCHKHRMDVDNMSRLPEGNTPCGLDKIYQPCYPSEEPAVAQYSFEIDKDRGVYVTVGVALPDEEDDEIGQSDELRRDPYTMDETSSDEDDQDGYVRIPHNERIESNSDPSLEHKLDRLNISDANPPEPPSVDQTVGEHYQDPCYRRDVFLSSCVNNKLRRVASLLQTYKDERLLECKDVRGSNCIALVATCGHRKMIRFLHRKGADIHSVDGLGRTPLMEAALWGHLKVFEYLLDHGADPRATDNKGQNAYFYATPSRKTAAMRRRLPYWHEARGAETNRRVIALRLEEYEERTTAQEIVGSESAGRQIFITQGTDPDRQICHFRCCTTYRVGASTTVARLDRGKLFPIISANSKYGNKGADGGVLDNPLWLANVLELCRLIEYDLRRPGYERYEKYDQPGLPGSYNATHAEKKLVAYYIHEHMILPETLLEGHAAQGSGTWARKDLKLQHLAPLAPRVPGVRVPGVRVPGVRANIRVSKRPCSDCVSFISYVNGKLLTSFKIEEGETLEILESDA